MKTLTVLINKSALDVTYISEKNYNYFRDYIDYKLQPFIKLGLFSYNIHRNSQPPLDGSISPAQLIDALHEYIVIPHNDYADFLSSKYPCFLNIQTQQHYLTSIEYIKICQAPYNYCLFYTEIFPHK